MAAMVEQFYTLHADAYYGTCECPVIDQRTAKQPLAKFKTTEQDNHSEEWTDLQAAAASLSFMSFSDFCPNHTRFHKEDALESPMDDRDSTRQGKHD